MVIKEIFGKVKIYQLHSRVDNRGSLTCVFDDNTADFKALETRIYSMPKEGTFFGIHYLDKEYLDKCLMVKSIIKAAGHPLQMSDLDRIAKKMGIDYISVYDEKGKNVLTNSPFSEDQISKGGYFYPLLMGRDSMIKDPDNDNVQGRIIQYIGASLQNDQGTSDGLVLIGMDLTALKDIRDSLGFENIIRQGNLLEGTFLALIDKSTSMFKNAALVENKEVYEEENKYNYFSVAGEDKDSKYNRYAYYLLGEEDINLGEDYTNMSLEDLGLTPEVLNANYSGRQTIKNIDYYACSSK